MFLTGTFVPLYMLTARFVSPSVKGQLFRVHRREYRWLRYLNGEQISQGSFLPQILSYTVWVLHGRGRGDDNPIPLPVRIL